MADIKTHLRELSVATTVGLLKQNINFDKNDLYNSKIFYRFAQKVISNDISSAGNILELEYFDEDLKIIIQNGYKLGIQILTTPHFKISKHDKIEWKGSDTQKGEPIDLVIGDYKFSLKEESFILKNMGLYQLLNNLTGSNYARGLHIFSVFSLKEYDAWFNYTWLYLIKWLSKGDKWELIKANNKSTICLKSNDIVEFHYNNRVSLIPVSISTNKEYMKYTVSATREKVFSKWISEKIADDSEYIRLKQECSVAAGKKVTQQINNNYNPDNVYDFFQIYPTEYYYAKTTPSETTILKVPSIHNFNSTIKFIGSKYDVPLSQLNIISTFENKNTNQILEFRNECRFSHGQFNGTPEAKMYISRNSSLTNLYEPII